MQALRAVNSEPIPGYRLLERLGRGGFGEVWKCEAPGGLFKAIKFVRGNQGLEGTDGAEQELRALQHIRTIRHSYLLSIERVEVVEGDLLIVMELADRSLHDLLVHHTRSGQKGIPRAELLDYLYEAAEVLDLMNQEHGLQHLDIKPRNLFLIGRHLKVADFGLVASLAELYSDQREDLLGAITPLYAAPEVFDGKPTLFSDQYSLAVTYHELLTGGHPFKARNMQQMMLLIATTDPDLSGLPEADRNIVGRALCRQPRERYPSCMAFIEALLGVQAPAAPTETTRSRITSHEIALGETPPANSESPSGNSLLAAADALGRVEATTAPGILRRASRVFPALGSSGNPTEGPLQGYRLQECLGRGPTGEQWRAIGPNDKPCLVRFLNHTDPAAAQGPQGAPRQQWAEDPLRRLLELYHSSLPLLRLLPMGPDRCALISELGETSLQARFKDCHSAGQQGVPRLELLHCLGQTAEALDELYHQHQLQHLLLSPRLISLRADEVLLLDFGLAELLWLPAGEQLAGLNPRYAALELFDGLVSDACDQFSLALMFQEMLVGIHPYRNLNARQMANPRLRGLPDVSLLPGPDRPIVQQALAAEPERRFRSCREFVLALEEVTRQVEHGTVVVPAACQPTVPLTQPCAPRPTPATLPAVTPAAPAPAPAVWRPMVEELISAASRGQEIRTAGTLSYRFAPTVEVEHRCWARLVPGMARLKIKGFAEQWHAQTRSRTQTRFIMEVQTPAGFLDRCLGRVPGLVIDIRLGTPRESAAQLTPIRIRITPSPPGHKRAQELLAEVTPDMLTSLQTYLHSQSDRGDQERYPLRAPVEVQPPGHGGRITAEMCDLGRRGMGLLSARPVGTGPVTLLFGRAGSATPIQVNGWVRDCLPADDKHEIEVAFEG